MKLSGFKHLSQHVINFLFFSLLLVLLINYFFLFVDFSKRFFRIFFCLIFKFVLKFLNLKFRFVFLLILFYHLMHVFLISLLKFEILCIYTFCSEKRNEADWLFNFVNAFESLCNNCYF